MGFRIQHEFVGDANLKRQKRETSIPAHAHCLICGVTISENETFCSNECRDKYEKMMRGQKYSRLIAFLPIIVVTIFLILLFFLKGT